MKRPLNFVASQNEIEQFRRYVKAANQIQRRYTERQARITGKNPQDIDPIFFKRSAKLSQFSNRQEFLDAMNRAKELSRPGYVKHINEVQKQNFIDSIINVFGDAADSIVRALGKVSARKLADLQAKGLLVHTGFIYYDPGEIAAKRQELIEQLQALGLMNQPEDDKEDEE